MKYGFLVLGFLAAGCASKQLAASDKKPQAQAPVAAAPAAPVAAPALLASANKLTCSQGSDSRVLEIVTTGKGCSLDYTKAGKKTAAASSMNGTKHCEDSKNKIRSRLEKSGFQCL